MYKKKPRALCLEEMEMNIEVQKQFQDKKGIRWELDDKLTLVWPNGNLCRIGYKNPWGGTCIIRWNEAKTVIQNTLPELA